VGVGSGIVVADDWFVIELLNVAFELLSVEA
jgi:hypothetical protein